MNWSERARHAITVRDRTGQITATEIMLRSGTPEDKIAEHVLPVVLPHLCGPFGRVMPQ